MKKIKEIDFLRNNKWVTVLRDNPIYADINEQKLEMLADKVNECIHTLNSIQENEKTT